MSTPDLRIAGAVPEVADAALPTDVPPPPKVGLSSLERETWLELAPQVSATKCYDPSLYTAFRLLVAQIADAFALADDSADTARARAFQSAQAAMGRWGLTPKDRRHASKAEGTDEGRHGKWRRGR